MDGLATVMGEAEADLKPQGGRILLRYSGTEPKARLLLEGRDSAMLDRWAPKIASVVKAQVGA
jgi:phosphoglucosamine mutase